MKNVPFIATSLIISFSLALSAQAEKDAYYLAMQEALDRYSNVNSLDDYQEITNTFERISQMEKEEWLPRYYSALTYVYMSFENGLENKERDNYLAIAEGFAGQAEELSENNVEIVILEGYIKMAKLNVNPAIRGMTMTPKVTGLFERARKMAPENPRAIMMLARMKYGTAQFFKSSIEESCALAEKSLELYEKETDRGIEPSWGKEIAENLMSACSRGK
ncbi:MAG: hypothetical protein U5L96_03720 [Owenweeksia sp.]|nr:hypothetical protein [Owenweeksia sp.]